ncbi:penicillin-binding protein, putative [Metarhizium acridum CQMa 102]|uniref:Penicillin-binding protein, putative n=1 Tax=Metarhizium acridum (strain CQMa 102) TaxID=655827 RepID=E9E7E3_METAQ|nr:penicillin-binding protein, putative [Metarhizium acridum CQMa 102]EFY88185.1 penicillin-binding protein, putative [Metarhizium acridum CQMa 102]
MLLHGGSTTKVFVDAALAQLILNGSYPVLNGGWSTPISSIIRDDFVLQDEWATNHLALEDAASHRTVPNRDLVRNLCNLPLTAPPRVIFHYCNLMYITLSHVVETVTGRRLKDVLREAVWAPLGMKSTYLDLQEARDAGKKLAQGYLWNQEDKQYMAVFDPIQESSGAGGIVSSVLDYAKWLKCPLRQTRPFSSLAHGEIRTPRVIYEAAPAAGYDVTLYGLGWSRTVFHGQAMYSHNGATGAFGAFQGPPHRRTEGGAQRPPGQNRQRRRRAIPRETSPRPPPTQNTTRLAGTYLDPGYGTIQLKEMTDPEDAASAVLVGDRSGIIIDSDVLLRHVSGDYWVLHLSSADVPLEMGAALAAEFKFGSDGSASALEVIWGQAKPGLREVKVLFNKME